MFKKFSGSVNHDHFGAFYGIMVAHASHWNIREEGRIVYFVVDVLEDKADTFKSELCSIVPCVELDKEPTLIQKIINFITKKKGNACEQCC